MGLYVSSITTIKNNICANSAMCTVRSGQVHRSLVGHTGPVTCLQFDDVHLVTGSLDRSIRVCILHYQLELLQAYELYLDMGSPNWVDI